MLNGATAKPRAFATGKVRPAKAVVIDAVPVWQRDLPDWNRRLAKLAYGRG